MNNERVQQVDNGEDNKEFVDIIDKLVKPYLDGSVPLVKNHLSNSEINEIVEQAIMKNEKLKKFFQRSNNTKEVLKVENKKEIKVYSIYSKDVPTLSEYITNNKDKFNLISHVPSEDGEGIFIDLNKYEVTKLQGVCDDEYTKLLESPKCPCCGRYVSGGLVKGYRDNGGCCGSSIVCADCHSLNNDHYYKVKNSENTIITFYTGFTGITYENIFVKDESLEDIEYHSYLYSGKVIRVEEKDMEKAIKLLIKNKIKFKADYSLRLFLENEAEMYVLNTEDDRLLFLTDEKENELIKKIAERLWDKSERIFDNDERDSIIKDVIKEMC